MDECFYKLMITKDKPVPGSYYFEKKSDVWHVGYFPYKEVLKEVEAWYERGADAVEMEMITQEQFDEVMRPYTDESYYYEQRKK